MLEAKVSGISTSQLIVITTEGVRTISASTTKIQLMPKPKTLSSTSEATTPTNPPRGESRG